MADAVGIISGLAGDGSEADALDEQVRTMLRSSFGQSFRSRYVSSPVHPVGPTNNGEWRAANRLYRQIIKRLKKKLRHQGLSGTETRLLKVLRSCKPRTPCASAACPKCTHALQCVMAMLHGELRDVGIRLDGCITIIAPQTITEPDTSREAWQGKGTTSPISEPMRNFTDELHVAFGEAAVTIVIGGIDLDWQEFRDGADEPHGRPHLHALVWRKQVEAGRRHLNVAFPRANTVNRPVQLEDFDGNKRWLLYSLKYPNRRTIRNRDEEGRWQNPDYKKPTVEQQLHQALILHEVGWGGRLYLRGVELKTGPRGWQLALTDFTPEIRQPTRRRR